MSSSINSRLISIKLKEASTVLLGIGFKIQPQKMFNDPVVLQSDLTRK